MDLTTVLMLTYVPLLAFLCIEAYLAWGAYVLYKRHNTRGAVRCLILILIVGVAYTITNIVISMVYLTSVLL